MTAEAIDFNGSASGAGSESSALLARHPQLSPLNLSEIHIDVSFS
jgi:hypothetical protein